MACCVAEVQATTQVYLNPLGMKKAARMALDNYLYVDGWTLQHRLTPIADRRYAPYAPCVGISLAFIDGNPVGVCVAFDRKDTDHYYDNYTNYCDHFIEVNFYVKTEFRRHGIGTQMFGALKPYIATNKRIEFFKGIQESEDFFSSLAKKFAVSGEIKCLSTNWEWTMSVA